MLFPVAVGVLDHQRDHVRGADDRKMRSYGRLGSAQLIWCAVVADPQVRNGPGEPPAVGRITGEELDPSQLVVEAALPASVRQSQHPGHRIRAMRVS